MAFNLLRKEKSLEITCTLIRGAKGIREIQRAVGGSYKTIYARIKELVKADLIEEEYLSDEVYGERPTDMRLMRLTKKGKELVQSMIDSGFAKALLLPKARERWIIAILHILGIVRGRTRFMKLLFLLKNEFGFTKNELGGFYRFRAGKFGPFSRGVMKDLEELQEEEFVEVKSLRVSKDKFNEEQEFLHVYRLTSKWSGVVQEAFDNLPSNTLLRLGKLAAFNGRSLMELLKYVYINYRPYIVKSTIVEEVLNQRNVD